jgi:DNA (cytosine-5)-methyltransferase 1
LNDFNFPQKQPLELRLKDLLEDEVNEKYYLSERMINFFVKNEQVQKEKGNGFRFGVSDGNIIAKAVTTRAGGRMDDNFIKYSDKRIRKLTPKECWRLMGFSDEDFEKAAKMNSNTQLYKQAGNSIVVNVLEEIFKNLFF